MKLTKITNILQIKEKDLILIAGFDSDAIFECVGVDGIPLLESLKQRCHWPVDLTLERKISCLNNFIHQYNRVYKLEIIT